MGGDWSVEGAVVALWQLPFLRWKKVPILAAGCILAVRALVVQLGFHAHMKGHPHPPCLSRAKYRCTAWA